LISQLFASLFKAILAEYPLLCSFSPVYMWPAVQSLALFQLRIWIVFVIYMCCVCYLHALCFWYICLVSCFYDICVVFVIDMPCVVFVVYILYMPCVVFMTYICLMSVIYICVCRVRDIYALCCVYYMSGACDKYALCCVRNTLMRLDILQNCSCVFVGAGMWVVWMWILVWVRLCGGHIQMKWILSLNFKL
jgi:hypothetical protein